MKTPDISVIDVAAILGTRKQRIFKIISRLNIDTRLERSEAAGGQKIAYISAADFERVKGHVEATGANRGGESVDGATGGVFYLIQLEPAHDPNRVKLGFASEIGERLRSHHTAAPYAKVIKTWPCKLLWEKTAIDSVTIGCTRIHTEVFDGVPVEIIKDRCERFFSLMPPIDHVD